MRPVLGRYVEHEALNLADSPLHQIQRLLTPWERAGVGAEALLFHY